MKLPFILCDLYIILFFIIIWVLLHKHYFTSALHSFLCIYSVLLVDFMLFCCILSVFLFGTLGCSIHGNPLRSNGLFASLPVARVNLIEAAHYHFLIGRLRLMIEESPIPSIIGPINLITWPEFTCPGSTMGNPLFTPTFDLTRPNKSLLFQSPV